MSHKGDCWDNAPMESFFHTLKPVHFFGGRSVHRLKRSLCRHIRRRPLCPRGELRAWALSQQSDPGLVGRKSFIPDASPALYRRKFHRF